MTHDHLNPSADLLYAAASWLALSRLPKMGPAALARLYRRHGSIQTILEQSHILNFKFEIDPIYEQLQAYAAQGIQTIPVDSPAYPLSLLDLRVPPMVLSLSGELLPKDRRAIAIVGTRTPSKEGRRIAREVSRRAVAAGFCVVSGLARGIDTEAHRGALLSGGRTIAVLGNGLASVYPPENASLAARILRRGALVSELPPEAPVSRRGLLARDRLQAALSLAVIVIQTHTGCGSLTTARDAIACRRPLFALHWQEEPYTIGLARLRQIGAKVINAYDLDKVFNAASLPDASNLFSE